MTLVITSKVARGEHVGETQTPYRHSDGLYVVSPTKFEGDYIRVSDLRSVANAVAAGLRVRMKSSSQKTAGLVKPDSVEIDGLAPAEWQTRKALEEGRQ